MISGVGSCCYEIAAYADIPTQLPEDMWWLGQFNYQYIFAPHHFDSPLRMDPQLFSSRLFLFRNLERIRYETHCTIILFAHNCWIYQQLDKILDLLAGEKNNQWPFEHLNTRYQVIVNWIEWHSEPTSCKKIVIYDGSFVKGCWFH